MILRAKRKSHQQNRKKNHPLTERNEEKQIQEEKNQWTNNINWDCNFIVTHLITHIFFFPTDKTTDTVKHTQD